MPLNHSFKRTDLRPAAMSNFGFSKMRSLAALLILGIANASAAELLMSCDDLVVQYSAPTIAPLETRVSVKPLPQRPSRILEEKDPEFIPESRHRTVAFNRVAIADTIKPGPYFNAIEVFSTKGDPVSWRLEIANLKDNVRLQWLTEDLLFLQAWWGRIVSTDMIFEVSSGRFIYAKEANYGLLIQPCEEPNPSVKGTFRKRAAPYVEH